MLISTYSRRRALAAAVTLAALIASPLMAGVASASTPGDPPGGATPVAPHFYNGNVEGIRSAGSDTDFFLMQKIGDLYTGAGLYGCTLNTGSGNTLYNSSDPASSSSNAEFYCQSGANTSTSDVNDNWDRTEVTEGVDDIGSSAGQSQLCGALATPLAVDFARSAKPAGTACSLAEAGFAKDGLPIIDYPLDPNTYGTSTTAPYSSINGGVVGDVAEGWLPGDPTDGSANTGTALAGINNSDGGGSDGSTAYRLWCASTPAGNPVTSTSQITDWGALTNLGPSLLIYNATVTSGSPNVSINPDVDGVFATTVASGDAVSGAGIPSGTIISSVSGSSAVLSNNATASGTPNLKVTTSGTLAVGQGMPIGVPIRIMGVNPNSGTESTFALYANSGGGTSSGGCEANMNTDAALDPNPVTKTADNTTAHIALENDSDQLDEFAIGDFPSPDFVDQAVEVATTLYIESNGVFNTNPYAAAATVDGTSYSGNKLEEDGFATTTVNLLQNHYPTARTLFNVYRTDTIRASAGGFLNWICDSNTNFNKGLDNSTGLNFDSELTTTISTVYGFPRLTDTSSAPAVSTPADGQAAPNNSCAASLGVTSTSGSTTVTLTAGGNFAPDIVNAGGLVGGGNVGVVSANFPAGTTVVSGAGTSTLTLSQGATATGSATTVFSGVPAVTAVANQQT
jgi:hypothetical protein